jgi:hypothetical protein
MPITWLSKPRGMIHGQILAPNAPFKRDDAIHRKYSLILGLIEHTTMRSGKTVLS